jgi:hypothetical protein
MAGRKFKIRDGFTVRSHVGHRLEAGHVFEVESHEASDYEKDHRLEEVAPEVEPTEEPGPPPRGKSKRA